MWVHESARKHVLTPDPLLHRRVVLQVARLAPESKHNLVNHHHIHVQLDAHKRPQVRRWLQAFKRDDHHIFLDVVAIAPLVIGKQNDRTLIAIVVP